MHRILIFLLLISFSTKAQTVYKTPSGHKYHNANCHTVKNVSEAITVEEARRLGLAPCRVCRPENIYASGSMPVKKAQGEATTSQCLGFTKNGTRCRHMTSIGNGYCYQHQPK